MKSFLGLAALAAGALLASQAQAARVPEAGISAEEVAQVLQAKGYKAEIGKDNEGDPKVTSAADGSKFTVFFYGCQHTARCTSLTLQSGFHLEGGMTMERINAWNKDNRFLKGWLDNVNDPFVEMDIEVGHAFLTETLGANIETWASIIPDFKKYIGFQ
ncbi:MAG: YbjN domain-containing protein [Caulobacteraceae bacterium]|nr:YbjN domain-containing protein [Caulobacteraceae bacterium]